jgi:X-Pro dipeptidyl-peptidase (S15 family)
LRSTHRARGGPEKVFQLRRLLPLVLLVIAVVLASFYWSWIDAQARAVVVLSSLLETPILTPVIRGVTGEPRFEEETVAGNPALVLKPKGEGPWPALFFVNGAVREGRELPEVRRLAEGFARAGYLAVVPDLPGLRSDEITSETVSGTLEVARAVSERPDARDGRVGLVGVSTGATLALLTAKDPSLEGRVSVVAGVAPYADIRTILNLATSGYYQDGEDLVPYEADSFLSYVVARSLVAALPPGEDRETLRSELEEVERFDPDPLAGFRDRPLDDLGSEARSVVELLANRDPERFDELYGTLPNGVRGDLDKLSPLAGGERVDAPVELVSGPQDKYFPISESHAVARIAPNHRVTVTEALDHAELSFSIRDVPAFLRMNGFAVRSLREARGGKPADWPEARGDVFRSRPRSYGLRFGRARKVVGDRRPARGRRGGDGPVPLFVRSGLLRYLRCRVLQIRVRAGDRTRDRDFVHLSGRPLADAELPEGPRAPVSRARALSEVPRAGVADFLLRSAHHLFNLDLRAAGDDRVRHLALDRRLHRPRVPVPGAQVPERRPGCRLHSPWPVPAQLRHRPPLADVGGDPTRLLHARLLADLPLVRGGTAGRVRRQHAVR